MTSQPGYQAMVIHTLPNTSQSKSSQTLKYGQVMEHNKKNIFLQKSSEKWGRETSSIPLFFLQKRSVWGKSKWSAA